MENRRQDGELRSKRNIRAPELRQMMEETEMRSEEEINEIFEETRDYMRILNIR